MLTKAAMLLVGLTLALLPGCGLVAIAAARTVDEINSSLSYYRRIEVVENTKYLVEINRYVGFQSDAAAEDGMGYYFAAADTTFPVMEISRLDGTNLTKSDERIARDVATKTCARKPWMWGETDFGPAQTLDQGVWKFLEFCK